MNEHAKRAVAEGKARVLGAGRYLKLLDEHGWEYVTRGNVTGVVVIVALTPAGNLVLVEQPRTALHKRIIELPAGLVGDLEAGETLLAAARRELIEETGYQAREMVFLAEGPVAVGLSDEVLTFFHARDLSRVGPGGGDETEDITVHEVPLRELRGFLAARAAEGLAIDPKIYAGLFLIGAQVPA